MTVDMVVPLALFMLVAVMVGIGLAENTLRLLHEPARYQAALRRAAMATAMFILSMVLALLILRAVLP